MTNRAAVDGNDDARIGCYRKKRRLASHFGGGGRLAKSCTCRKSNPDILALGEGYAGFARRHPCGAAFRTSSFVLGDEDGRPTYPLRTYLLCGRIGT
jgi:hypothetical protein